MKSNPKESFWDPIHVHTKESKYHYYKDVTLFF